jgi:predicted nucleic acid-binding protein
MTKLVVDASVAIKWFIPEPLSVEARRILDDYQAGTLSLLAPDLINAEVGNIVWKKQTFQGLGAADARTVIDEFRKLAIVVTPTRDLLEDAYTRPNPWAICVRLTLSGVEHSRGMPICDSRRKISQHRGSFAFDSRMAAEMGVTEER